MINIQLLEDVKNYAYSEIEKFWFPTKVHFDLSFEKGKEIAEKLGANIELVLLGVCFIDIKLGQAIAENRLADHIQMWVDACNAFLEKYEVSDDEKKIIINSIEAHHSAVSFESLEAEIIANADCYRFLHPKGVLYYISVLTKRWLEFDEVLKQAEYKLDEKWSIVSLECCKQELGEHYKSFKKMFTESK